MHNRNVEKQHKSQGKGTQLMFVRNIYEKKNAMDNEI